MEHELKTWPVPFQAILDGLKRYEVRRADRGFTVGDTLLLREWRPAHEGSCVFEGDDETLRRRPGEVSSKICTLCRRRAGESLPGEYTIRKIRVRVTYLTPGGQFGVPREYVVLGVERVEDDHWKVRAERAEAVLAQIRTRLSTYEGDVNLLALTGEIVAMVGATPVALPTSEVARQSPPQPAGPLSTFAAELDKMAESIDRAYAQVSPDMQALGKIRSEALREAATQFREKACVRAYTHDCQCAACRAKPEHNVRGWQP